MTPEEWIQAWRQLDNGCTALFRAQACRLGLSDAQFQILYELYLAPQPLTQNELAARLFAPKQTVNSAVAQLVRQQYVSLTQRPGPGNTKLAALTADGRTFCAAHMRRIVEAEQRAAASLSDAQRQAFAAIYAQWLQNLKGELEP